MGPVAGVGEMKNTYKIWVRKWKGRDHLRKLDVKDYKKCLNSKERKRGTFKEMHIWVILHFPLLECYTSYEETLL
jgi:hypothetical protein